MFEYNCGEQADLCYRQLISDSETYRRFFQVTRKPTRRSTPAGRRSSKTVRNCVTALAECRWDRTAEIRSMSSSVSAFQAIEDTIRGRLDTVSKLSGELSDLHSDPDSWAIDVAARAIVTYATGESQPELKLPVLMERLLTLLPGTTRMVRDILCLSLALAAYSQKNVALGSFLLGHKTHALAESTRSQWTANTATRAAFGFSIVAVGDTVTGRRILLGVGNAYDSAQTPLFTGIVDAELVGLQLEAGDGTSANHWLARTEQFARRYDCKLLARRALSAQERLRIGQNGE